MGRRAKWIAGMCAVGGLLLLPAAARAVFPGENGRICAFVSGIGGPPNNDTGFDVYILDGPGDARPTPLTSTTGAAGAAPPPCLVSPP